MAAMRSNSGERVRIGPITVLTLVTVICLSVLAVLAISTAHATEVLTQRQADAATQQYVSEIAAQTFVAETDARLASVRDSGGDNKAGAQAVRKDIDAICAAATEAGNGSIEVEADVDESAVTATLTSATGRTIIIKLAIDKNAGYRIEKWKVTAVQNEEQPMGDLWTG